MPESLNPNVGKDSSSRIEKERAAFLKFTGRPAGSAGGVAARNTQHQNMTQAVERLLSAIDESGGTDDEKIAASFEFMGFVNGVIKAAAVGGARAVIDLLKGSGGSDCQPGRGLQGPSLPH
jgi:hypothetical protein